jgi:predicted nuclease with TOPRIM domain
MADSINNLSIQPENNSDYSQLQRELEDLQSKNQRLLNTIKELRANLSNCSRESQRLTAEINGLREKYSPLSDRVERLIERINENNSLQKKWRDRINRNRELREIEKQIIVSWGNDFYQKFFYTPISID